MKKNYLSILVFLLFVLIISCKTQSAEDKLADGLSKSKNFMEWEQSIEEMKNQFTALSKDSSFTRKYKDLPAIQQRDSLTKLIMRSDNYIQTMHKMQDASAKTKLEFPQFEKLSKESKNQVFLKAWAIIIANKPLK